MRSEFSNKMNNHAPVLGRASLLERYLKSNTHDWGTWRYMLANDAKRGRYIKKRSGSVKTKKVSKSNQSDKEKGIRGFL